MNWRGAPTDAGAAQESTTTLQCSMRLAGGAARMYETLHLPARLSHAAGAGLAFAHFVMLTPYPGTVDFEVWEKRIDEDASHVAGIPITRHWLIPHAQCPKVYAPHPVMTPDEIRARTQAV